MYQQLTRYLWSLDKADAADRLDLCKQLGDDLIAADLADPRYMTTLDAQGVDEPWEADVSSLDLAGCLALLTFVQRCARWRDDAYQDALDGGLLVATLRRMRELDGPCSGESGESGDTLVTKAELRDIDELVDLRLAYLSEDLGALDEGDVQAIRTGLPDYYRRHLGRDLTVYAIRRDGSIVSCAFLLVVEKPLSPSFITGKTATVLNVYTRPEHRRKGFARTLMQALLDDAREMDVSVVELKATDDGYPLYQSVGFADDRSPYHLMKWVRSS